MLSCLLKVAIADKGYGKSSNPNLPRGYTQMVREGGERAVYGTGDVKSYK